MEGKRSPRMQQDFYDVDGTRLIELEDDMCGDMRLDWEDGDGKDASDL